MNDMKRLEEVKRQYPAHNFRMDPETSVIGFEFEEMWITDPFISECGRFQLVPSYYGIDMATALWMHSHNLLAQPEASHG
jgi:hypothetical protein